MQPKRRTQAERRAETRGRLLASARKVFAERGYQAASVDLVSERAGCTKGALYHHFGSKEGLMLELLGEHAVRRRGEAVGEGGTPAERMPFDREFALLFLEFVTAAAREEKLRVKLAASLREARATSADLLGDGRLAAVFGAIANGASIEALIFGEAEGAATFDAAVEAMGTSPAGGSIRDNYGILDLDRTSDEFVAELRDEVDPR